MSYFSLFIYFLVMLGIGVFAYFRSTSNQSEYLLGGRCVSPQVTALSAGASDMSGWMLMGLPGAMFVMGFESSLIALGLLVGAFCNFVLVAPRLRVFTEQTKDSLTIPTFFSNRLGSEGAFVRILSAVVIVIFFTLYTASGLVAGGKLFETAFGASFVSGVVITMLVVVGYTLLGGFLAVSLTDFVQGCIMFVALVLVPVVAFGEFQSGQTMITAAYQSIPSFSSALTDITAVAMLSSFAWGLGYFGQPHIVVRFMAIRSVKDIKTARRIGMSWMAVTIIGALGTGLIGVAYVNHYGLQLSDPETIFVVFADILFHPVISGFLMAAILAAIMSTISSQLLVSASSLVEDIYGLVDSHQTGNRVVLLSRLGVCTVALCAMAIALSNNTSVLQLVSSAWAGFGAAFGPLLLACLYYKNLTERGAVSGIITGALVVLFWRYAPVLSNGQTLSSTMYEIIPGFVMSGLTIVLVSAFERKPNSEAVDSFEKSHIQFLKQTS